MGEELESTYADIVVRAMLLKIRALEEYDVGLLSKTSVTTADRVLVILSSISPKHRQKVVETKHTEEDVKRVMELATDTGVYDAELVLLSKVRRYIIEVAKQDARRVVEVFDTRGEDDFVRKRVVAA